MRAHGPQVGWAGWAPSTDCRDKFAAPVLTHVGVDVGARPDGHAAKRHLHVALPRVRLARLERVRRQRLDAQGKRLHHLGVANAAVDDDARLRWWVGVGERGAGGSERRGQAQGVAGAMRGRRTAWQRSLPAAALETRCCRRCLLSPGRLSPPSPTHSLTQPRFSASSDSRSPMMAQRRWPPASITSTRPAPGSFSAARTAGLSVPILTVVARPLKEVTPPKSLQGVGVGAGEASRSGRPSGMGPPGQPSARRVRARARARATPPLSAAGALHPAKPAPRQPTQRCALEEAGLDDLDARLWHAAVHLLVEQVGQVGSAGPLRRKPCGPRRNHHVGRGGGGQDGHGVGMKK